MNHKQTVLASLNLHDKSMLFKVSFNLSDAQIALTPATVISQSMMLCNWSCNNNKTSLHNALRSLMLFNDEFFCSKAAAIASTASSLITFPAPRVGRTYQQRYEQVCARNERSRLKSTCASVALFAKHSLANETSSSSVSSSARQKTHQTLLSHKNKNHQNI